jgi:hypothetical protein
VFSTILGGLEFSESHTRFPWPLLRAGILDYLDPEPVLGIPSPVEFEFSGQLDVATDVRASLRRRDSNVAPKGVRKK